MTKYTHRLLFQALFAICSAASALAQDPPARLHADLVSQRIVTAGAIVATQSADGSFKGTFPSGKGTVKAVRLEKTSEQAMPGTAPAASAAKEDQVFANEDKDWNVDPTSTPRTSRYHAPTPRTVPGGRVIRTMELKSLLDREKAVVIDVLDSKERTTVPGAYWMFGAGSGQFFAGEKARFAAALEKLTGGDKGLPVVFLCLSSECWLSYNASLHAIEAGYRNVIWYRGGTDAWGGAGLPRKSPQRIGW